MDLSLDRSAGLDDVVERLAKTVDHLARGILTGAEATAVAAQALVEYLRSGAGDHATQNLAWELCRCAVEDIAKHGPVPDPVLLEHFEEEVQSHLLGAELSEQLELVLAELRVRAAFDDPDVRLEIVDLAAEGLRTHRLLLSVRSAPGRIIRLAHELRMPEALAAAVTPGRTDANIADPAHHPDEFRLALDLLGHLASEPDSEIATQAIDILLDVAAIAVDGCADAVARLPLHRLDDDQRLRLLAIHEARVELFTGSDPMCVPLGLETLRANRIVRTALWQAFDVSRM